MGDNRLTPVHAVDEIRAEYDLDLGMTEHIHFLRTHGLLNAADVRTMLSRHAVSSLLERHGDDSGASSERQTERTSKACPVSSWMGSNPHGSTSGRAVSFGGGTRLGHFTFPTF